MEKLSVLKNLLVGFIQSRWINKYTISALLFFAWIGFFDKNNLVTQYQLRAKVKKMERTKAEYEEKLAQAQIERNNFQTNLEKYAREKYFMKRSNEDVFIIQRD